MTIRIAIGCHSFVLGEGLKKLFKDDEGIDIIGIFDEGIDLKEIIKLNPDIILADLKIFRTFPENIITDNVKILLISDSSWIAEVERQLPELLLRGVCGILLPDADSDMLKKAVKVIYSGELWLDRKLLKNILYHVTNVEKRADLTKKGERDRLTHLSRLQEQGDCTKARYQRTDRQVSLQQDLQESRGIRQTAARPLYAQIMARTNLRY